MDVLTECRLWFGISEIKVWLLSPKPSFWKNLSSPAMCCVKCLPILRMLSLTLTRRVVTDWYIDWLIYFVCCCCALVFLCFFMLAANWRNKVDYLCIFSEYIILLEYKISVSWPMQPCLIESVYSGGIRLTPVCNNDFFSPTTSSDDRQPW